MRRNKTDRADAKGLLEAYRNEAIHPVPVKEVSHQGVAAMHRLRSTWLATRTSRINTLRGILREIGFTIPVGAHHVVPRVEELATVSDSELPETLRPFLMDACREIRACERRMKEVESQLRRLQSQLPAVRRFRHRASDLDRSGRICYRRAALSQRAPLRQLSRADSTGVLDGVVPETVESRR